ncbi:MAG TPA: sugar ABC transporter permease [Mesotoga prima]|nr:MULTISPECIES: sugar ABC transporter permease [Mesotoga]MDK2945007.1 glucose/mannose transport system permease protein [Mesotoga sp.]HNQ70227.1 sugar ABC transporter permease [Mesotoga prima]HNS74678.1 sugar ABC transporter permease [Mesotoga prima]HOZ99530.1 sugar ABC transporter permease [Mesotoga prima]HPE52653.1 sugar ABC transporter permease [Mesotoga prima]
MFHIKRKTKRGIISFLILSPTFAAIGVFVYFFIGWTGRTSVSNWNSFARLLKGEFEFVGLRNYFRLFEDPRFQTDLWNTLYFTLFFILGCLLLGIVLAVLIDRNLKGSGIFRNIYLFPMALSFVVTGAVWRWIFAPGILPSNPQGMNLLFSLVGLDFLQWRWFTSTESFLNFNFALIPVIIAAVWQMSGYTMAMYLAGLRGISQDLVEAAEVDGATGWQIFWKIKFPILRPITLSAMIILGHISLKIFDLVYAMTGSGPNNVTDVPAIYMFETTFRANKYATGSAIAIIMLLMVAVVIIPYLASAFRKEKRI